MFIIYSINSLEENLIFRGCVCFDLNRWNPYLFLDQNCIQFSRPIYRPIRALIIHNSNCMTSGKMQFTAYGRQGGRAVRVEETNSISTKWTCTDSCFIFNDPPRQCVCMCMCPFVCWTRKWVHIETCGRRK